MQDWDECHVSKPMERQEIAERQPEYWEAEEAPLRVVSPSWCTAEVPTPFERLQMEEQMKPASVLRLPAMAKE
jgi:hypothetical protein